jgi:hypothetical protein
MNKRKRMAWRKHRLKRKKLEERRKQLPPSLRDTARRGGAPSSPRT